MGRRRKGRPINGVLLLDKPQGVTSNAALQKVRWLFQAQKAGHTGALDPLATGVLPICFGEATKYSQYLLNADKGYFTTATLGEIRESGDSDGEIVETRIIGDYDEPQLEAVLASFRGHTKQVPTMFSALKHQGRPLYEWARKGILVEREPRDIHVYQLLLTAATHANLDLTVRCSKGTYVRSLVEDIGLKLGCGAHVSMLRRFKAGHFELHETVSLDELIALEGRFDELDRFLRPTDCLLPDLPKICANNEQSRSLLHGQAVRIPASEKAGLARLYISREFLDDFVSDSFDFSRMLTEQGSEVFAGLVELDDEGYAQPKRLLRFSADSQ